MKAAVRSFAIAVLAIVPLFASAQEAQPTRWFVQQFNIKPGQQGTFEQLVLRYKAAAQELGDENGWFANSPAVGDMSVYSFASELKTWTQMSDRSDLVVEAFGEQAGQQAAAMAQASVESVQSMVMMHRPDVSIPRSEESPPAEATMMYFITLKPGVGEAWNEYMQNVIAASKATAPEAQWNSFQGGIGSPQNTFAVRVGLTWEEMDSPIKALPQRLVEHFGKRNGERIWQEANEMIDTMETSISHFRPDLSYIPEQAVASN